MKEAIEITQELVNNKLEIDEEEQKNHMDHLKPDINNLLHMYLPDYLTLKEVDILSMVINEIIWNPRRFLNKQ